MGDPGAIAAVGIVVLSYALGTFPTALLVGRRLGFDPTASGSGNPGASNAVRVGGARAGALVLLGDAGKGALAAGAGYAVDGRTLAWAAGAAAVAGHMWPATRRLRGGKGVATVAGVGLVCAPLAFLALGAVFAVVVRWSGKAALGSLVVAVLMPVAAVVADHDAVEVAVVVALAAAIVLRHRANIGRLLAGTEGGMRS